MTYECESDRYSNHDVWDVRVTTTVTMMYMECKNDRYSAHDVWSVRVTTTVTMTYGV